MSSPSSPRACSGWRWASVWRLLLVVTLAVCFPPSLRASDPSSPPTSPLGPLDYQTFLSDSLIVKKQLDDSKAALTQALEEKRTIAQNLAVAQLRYEDLLASATQHSDDSTASLQAALQEVARLTRLYNESSALVKEQQASFDLAKAEYDRKLGVAEAKALTLENRLKAWPWIALAALATGLLVGVLIP